MRTTTQGPIQFLNEIRWPHPLKVLQLLPPQTMKKLRQGLIQRQRFDNCWAFQGRKLVGVLLRLLGHELLLRVSQTHPLTEPTQMQSAHNDVPTR